MNRGRRIACGVAAVLAFLATDLPAQSDEPARDVAALARSVDRMHGSLEEIAVTLRELLKSQKLALVIRRVELEERRLAPLEAELGRARGDVRARREELASMQGIVEQVESQLDKAVRSGTDPQQMPERAEVRRIESMIELQEGQIAEAQRRVVDLENDVSRGRDRIEILDEKLEELLAASDP